jgi:hypothetical protein
MRVSLSVLELPNARSRRNHIIGDLSSQLKWKHWMKPLDEEKAFEGA